MPAEHHANPKLVAALAAELAWSSAAALGASHELLAHYGDTGSAPAQRAVETMIDHAADTLRALSDSFADIAAGLQTAALAASPSHTRTAGSSNSPGPS